MKIITILKFNILASRSWCWYWTHHGSRM